MMIMFIVVVVMVMNVNIIIIIIIIIITTTLYTTHTSGKLNKNPAFSQALLNSEIVINPDGSDVQLYI